MTSSESVASLVATARVVMESMAGQAQLPFDEFMTCVMTHQGQPPSGAGSSGLDGAEWVPAPGVWWECGPFWLKWWT